MLISINDILDDSGNPSGKPIPKGRRPWRKVGVFNPGKGTSAKGMLDSFERDGIAGCYHHKGFYTLYSAA
jgi:hypothetical protein